MFMGPWPNLDWNDYDKESRLKELKVVVIVEAAADLHLSYSSELDSFRRGMFVCLG